MKKLFIFILLIANTLALSFDKDDLYYSPGVQVGYGFGDGIFVGGQFTTGVYAQPLELSLIIPGISFGVRKYFQGNSNLMAYADIQLGAGLGAGGIGIGYVGIKPAGSNTWNHGYRTKLWIGCVGLLTYDFYKTPFKAAIHNVGLIGVRPFGKNVYYAN